MARKPTVSEDAAEIEELRANYAALTTMCDEYFGRILNYFDKHDMWRDTVLVATTDHGFLLGEHDCSGSRVTTILDEDDMSTDSDTALATQQSIKAYVDNNAGGASLANDANNRVVTATGSGGINGEANLIVTGDDDSLALDPFRGIPILTPADYLAHH